MVDKNDGLAKLESTYESARVKYGLPSFEQLEEEFGISRAAESESKLVIREIRKTINDKLSSYLHLFENFMNPSSGPVFVFSLLKGIKEEDNKKIKEIYKKLAKIQIAVLKLETIYNEKAEAEFIKNIFKEWNSLKLEISEIIEKFDKNFDVSVNSSSKGYFG